MSFIYLFREGNSITDHFFSHWKLIVDLFFYADLQFRSKFLGMTRSLIDSSQKTNLLTFPPLTTVKNTANTGFILNEISEISLGIYLTTSRGFQSGTTIKWKIMNYCIKAILCFTFCSIILQFQKEEKLIFGLILICNYQSNLDHWVSNYNCLHTKEWRIANALYIYVYIHIHKKYR